MAEKSDLLKEIETYIADTQAYAEKLRSKQLMQFPQEAYILTGALATEALTDEIGAEAAEKLGLEVISAGLKEPLIKCVFGSRRSFSAINSLLNLEIHPVFLRFRASL